MARACDARACQQVGQREEVAQRLRHLLAVDDQVLGVQPEADERAVVRRLALRDLVLVVRKDVVDAAAVDVEGLAEVLGAHRRALDVPARAARAPGRVPGRLARLGALPEHEVAHVFLLVLVRRHALAAAHRVEADTGELAVVGVGGDAEPDRAVALVGVALLEQPLHHGDHLGDVARWRAGSPRPARRAGRRGPRRRRR